MDILQQNWNNLC